MGAITRVCQPFLPTKRDVPAQYGEKTKHGNFLGCKQTKNDGNVRFASRTQGIEPIRPFGVLDVAPNDVDPARIGLE